MMKYEEEHYLYENIKDKIYPWVKESLVDHKALNGKYISDKDTPIVSFAGDLMVIFVIERDKDTYEILKDNMLPPDTDMELLYHTACENLARNVKFVIGHTLYGGFSIIADGYHEASSLCFKYIWSMCSEKLDDDIVIMAPTKDMVAVAAVIVLRKNATVKVLDILVPIMAVCYFVITIVIILLNIRSLPGVFERIIQEAFGIRQAAAGGFGAVLMNGVKRGLFSNEAGSGSAPCAAAAAECDTPVKAGFIQALGVFIDTIVICSCTAMIMLLVPEKMIAGLEGMELLQTAMNYHLGKFGVIFIAVTLFLFSFSTFLGILFYARGNVAYLLGDKWCWQTAYKILALVMLFIGGIAAYHIVWDLGDVGIGLMTIFNIVTLYPMGGEALEELRKYEKNKQ